MDRRTRADITRGILLVGLTSAVGVYVTAVKPAEDPLGDPLNNSKVYQRSMEMVGGQANLLAGAFVDWFKGLWHGKPLAFTLAVLTLIAALAFHFLSQEGPSGPSLDRK